MSKLLLKTVVDVGDDVQVEVDVRRADYNDSPRDFGKQARVYVHGVDDVDSEANGLLAASLAADDEKVWNPLNRKLHAVQKQYVEKALTSNAYDGFDRMDLTKLRFSAHAGCTCSCSPGFVYGGEWGRGLSVWLTFSRKPARTFTMDEFDTARS